MNATRVAPSPTREAHAGTAVTPRAPTALSQAAHAALLAHPDPGSGLKALAAQTGLKPGALYMGLRERLWGQAQGPGLDELRRLLSPEELTARLGPASAPSGPLAPEL